MLIPVPIRVMANSCIVNLDTRTAAHTHQPAIPMREERVKEAQGDSRNKVRHTRVTSSELQGVPRNMTDGE